MQGRKVESLVRHCFWIALLLHLLWLLVFSVSFTMQTKVDNKAETPPDYVPSYFYHEENSSVVQPQSTPTKQPVKETSKQGIEKPAPAKTQPQKTQPQAIVSQKNTQAVDLIGKDKVAKPLIVLIGKAITAHLVYPRIASDFNLKGISYVKFTVHPDGRVTGVRLVKSSSADVLDEAAVDAINNISPLYDVEQYLTKPEDIVFGIIFG